jgi:hypothetical protein
MAIKNEPLDAFGMTWGNWVRDCSAPFSRIEFADPFELSVNVDVAGLKDALATVGSLIGDEKLTAAVNKAKKLLPQGSATFKLRIAPEAGSYPCEGNPSTQAVYASIVLTIFFTITVTAGGTSVSVAVSITEHLDNKLESCACTPRQVAYQATTPGGHFVGTTRELRVAALPLSLIELPGRPKAIVSGVEEA